MSIQKSVLEMMTWQAKGRRYAVLGLKPLAEQQLLVCCIDHCEGMWASVQELRQLPPASVTGSIFAHLLCLETYHQDVC